MKSTPLMVCLLPLITASVCAREELKETQGKQMVSGIYPHLTAYSQSFVDGKFDAKSLDECGIGAVIPWAGKLWMVTYAPHEPKGSTHKLYSIDKDMKMTIHPESVGGTPAARMIHAESNQLFLGHYVIDSNGKIRVISPKEMPGRITAFARHLSDPANFIYYYDMEGMLYEVNVHTLEFKKLFNDPIPGEHGKGAYTAQGKLVLANNGISGHLDHPDQWQVSQEYKNKGPEDRGCLATYDGKTWELIEYRQFTEVTGPQGVKPTAEGANLPLWTMGWDKRAVRLKMMEGGKFRTFLLPKGCLNNDAAHGWFTEWPRIREIGGGKALMDMHGMLYDFPLGFKSGATGGIRPIARHLRYIPDFCDWNGKLVVATDETSIQGNPLAGQPQSNLWFGTYGDLAGWGDASAAGSIWVNDAIVANQASDPFLVNGFKKRIVHFSSDKAVAFKVEIDESGTDQWKTYKVIEVPANGYVTEILPATVKATWLRVTPNQDCKASVALHFGDQKVYDAKGDGKKMFASLASASDKSKSLTHWIYAAKDSRDLNVLTMKGAQVDHFADLDHVSLKFKEAPVKEQLSKLLETKPSFTVDEASVIVQSGGKNLRLPKGSAAYDQPFEDGWPRSHREVESERMLANIHGTFYEVPFWIVGQPALYEKMKPVCSHNKRIMDYATWRGLLVMSGVSATAKESEHVLKSNDGKQALWIGGVDDLWKLGKPVGHGGPWLDTNVQAGKESDPYLMYGYDKKSMSLKADRDTTITLEVDFDLLSGFKTYKSFEVKKGETTKYTFPDGFNAHWVRVKSNQDCKASVQFLYE